MKYFLIFSVVKILIFFGVIYFFIYEIIYYFVKVYMGIYKVQDDIERNIMFDIWGKMVDYNICLKLSI